MELMHGMAAKVPVQTWMQGGEKRINERMWRLGEADTRDDGI